MCFEAQVRTSNLPPATSTTTTTFNTTMASGMLINFSEMDYNAYNNDSDSSMYSDSTPPVADPIFAPYTPQPSSSVLSAAPPQDDVLLEVSGNSFIMNANDFQKLAPLPWKNIHASAYRLESSVSPDTFETVLGYVQSGLLPKRKKMKSREKDEVTSMAQTLGLRELVVHMTKKKGFFGR